MKESTQDKSCACWLRYETIQDEQVKKQYNFWCSEVALTEQSALLQTAEQELVQALDAMLGGRPRDTGAAAGAQGGRIVIGVIGSSPARDQALAWSGPVPKDSDGYAIRSGTDEKGPYISLAGHSERGALYAVFHFLKLLQTGKKLDALEIQEAPANGLRMINQWDNMDGSIERGMRGSRSFMKITASLKM